MRKKGFTLIELIIVILIIGLLVAIAVPAIFGMRRKAKESDAKAIIKDCISAVAQLYDDCGGKPDNWPFDADGFTAADETITATDLLTFLACTTKTDFPAAGHLNTDGAYSFPYIGGARLQAEYDNSGYNLSPFGKPYTLVSKLDDQRRIFYTIKTAKDEGTISQEAQLD